MADRGLVGPGCGVVSVGVNRDDVARWLAESCAAQGVPVVIDDPLIVRRVVTLLDGRGRERSSRSRSPAPDSGGQTRKQAVGSDAA